MVSRWFAFLVWAAVAASAVAWALRLAASPAPVPSHAMVAQATAPAQGDLTRLFGAPPAIAASAPDSPEAAAPANARFQLLGVVAPRGDGRRGGVALIAVDGKPPRAYRPGARIDGDHVVQSVRQREVTIGPRGGVALVSLQLPEVAPLSNATPPPPQAPTFPRNAMPFQNPGAAMAPPPRPVPNVQPVFPRATATQPTPPGFPRPTTRTQPQLQPSLQPQLQPQAQPSNPVQQQPPQPALPPTGSRPDVLR